MLPVLLPKALASTNSATGVEASLPANAADFDYLGEVSCASAGDCTAIGQYVDRSGHFQGLLLTETSGRWATAVKAPLPANADTNPEVSLDSVSCASARNCTAVGYYFSSGQDQEDGLLLTETSGRWATGVEAPLPANANKHADVSLGSVSCASAGNCTAVGSYDVSSGYSQGLLLTETSGTWAAGVEAPLPATADTIAGNGEVDSVSCASAGNCTAVGSYPDSSGYSQGLLLTETSGTWAAGVEASLPANAGKHPNVALGGGCAGTPNCGSVSCASAGNCTAVGGYEDSSGHQQGLLLTETSGKWATGVEASRPANAGRNPEVGLRSVSCASVGNCTAVGSYDDRSGHGQVLLLTETSGRWATGVEASLPANAAKSSMVDLFSVSCASAGNCIAVGRSFENSTHVEGLLLTETSGRWATGVEPPLPANASNTIPFSNFASVSCPSARNCTAVGLYKTTRNDFQGLLVSVKRSR